MLHDPNELTLFPRLDEETLVCLRRAGTELALSAGDRLFTEGDRSYQFYVVLEGEIRITKRVGGEEVLLTIHQPGEFTGEISMLTGAPAIATGTSIGESRVLRLDPEAFRHVMTECSPVAQVVLKAMAARATDVDAELRQGEKLAALGKLSAGLAHELNNPAAAAARAAGQMRGAIACLKSMALARDRPFSEAERRLVEELQRRDGAARAAAAALGPLDRSDREDELTAWLEEREVEGAWKLAPDLVTAGLTREGLAVAAGDLAGEPLRAALAWSEAVLAAEALAAEVEESTARVSKLVQAIKEYSYMDQASQQEIDLHDGLETTLTILGHKLKRGVEVSRDYDRTLPRICAHGGELNQVWTNLIDNAIDAMQGKGHLRIRTSREHDMAVVQITDDGPGIPAAIEGRIFDAFFTTKGVGEGTGLGLDIARRIIRVRHKGDLRFASRPGETTFEVRLPIAGAASDAV